MRKLAVYIVILISPVLLFTAPATARMPIFIWHSPYLGEMSIPKPVCRHSALYCASVAVERYDVRVAYGWSSGVKGKEEAHVQAQAKVGDSWVWLTMMGRNCYFGSQDTFDNEFGKNQPFLIEQYLTLSEYVSSMAAWAENERLKWMIESEEGK